MVSDLHLGKIEAYASLGLPLPSIMHEQLKALNHVIAATNPKRVLILGDLLHAPAGLTEPMLETVRVWREGHTCEFAVIPGNHDRHLDKVAQWWGMRALPERHDEGPFTFIHEPTAISGRFVFAGHVHPVVKLRSSADRLKLWCFVVDGECDARGDVAAGVCTLPAFCDFTSGGSVHYAGVADRQVFAIADGKVVGLGPPITAPVQ